MQVCCMDSKDLVTEATTGGPPGSGAGLGLKSRYSDGDIANFTTRLSTCSRSQDHNEDSCR